MATANPLDRLYELLPAIHRLRDHGQGEPLRALLRVIAEQVNAVEDDIGRLYENWFIETCEDWVVPYLGELIGYRPVHEAGEPGDVADPEGRARNKVLIPRREIANTVRYRRRKGGLALLELLAQDVAGWPARVVEFERLVAFTQPLNHLRKARGRSIDLRKAKTLARLNGPFDSAAHTVDIRPLNGVAAPRGRYHPHNIGLFVCRLRAYSATAVPAFHVDRNRGCFTFSPIGANQPLFVKPIPDADPTHIAGPLNLPLPITRQELHLQAADYYGPDKSFCLWTDDPALPNSQPIAAERIQVANLSHWAYHPEPNHVLVDPERGRIAFPVASARKMPKALWVTYHYGFSADMGGGEYRRPLAAGKWQAVYYVAGEHTVLGSATYPSLTAALEQWRQDAESFRSASPTAVFGALIEFVDNGVYVEQPEIRIEAHEHLEIRAAQGKRPLLRLLNVNQSAPEALRIQGPETGNGGKPGCVTLDGLWVVGRGLYVEGHIQCLTIRHTTLVPGWEIDIHCEPLEGAEPSIELCDTTARLHIEHSIVGSIEVHQDKVKTDPMSIHISDSILDATDGEIEVLSDADCGIAHANLTLLRSTVIGRVLTHAILLAENSLLLNPVQVLRRQIGCMRFCYVTACSRTPRRYHCQPDLAEAALLEQANAAGQTLMRDDPAVRDERLRVRPRFTSLRYGHSGYCQLACASAVEIRQGADDESEMGAFHDLYQPQRQANLRARLDEYIPAHHEAALIYLT